MRIFIGSSNEQFAVVKEIKRDLRDNLSDLPFGSCVDIVDWKEWFAKPEFNNEYSWKVLEKAFDYFDLAIMLLAADDKIISRGEEYVITRDNVLIEAGAFAHALGIKNVILLVDNDGKIKTPSDFFGLNVITFDYERGAENPEAYRRIVGKLAQISLDENAEQGENNIKPKDDENKQDFTRKGKLK